MNTCITVRAVIPHYFAGDAPVREIDPVSVAGNLGAAGSQYRLHALFAWFVELAPLPTDLQLDFGRPAFPLQHQQSLSTQA